jgi:hypothetical protein
MRAWAASALVKVGTREDVALLERLAESDPLVREYTADIGPREPQQVYPVRQAAKLAADALRTKAPAGNS